MFLQGITSVTTGKFLTSFLSSSFCLPGLQRTFHLTVLRFMSNDVIDTFVDDLVYTKAKEWRNKASTPFGKEPNLSAASRYLAVSTRVAASAQAASLAESDKVHRVLGAAQEDDVQLVSQLLSSGSFECDQNVLLQLIAAFVANKSTKGILVLQQFAQDIFPNEMPFICEAYLAVLKLKGDNVKALCYCEELYKKYPDMQRKVRSYLSLILADIVCHHGEAALVQCRSVVIRISKNFNDFRPIVLFWRRCFLSEWFSDHQMASELLNYVANNNEIKTIELHIFAATQIALKQHKPERVHDLIQDLLHCNLLKHVEIVMQALFCYKCSLGDLRGCTSIVQTCLDVGVHLTPKQHAQFVELLCDYKNGPQWRQLQKRKKSVKAVEAPTYNLKF